jgi:hypothetical protein
MARKALKSTAQTAEEGMKMILDTPVEKSISEAANFVGVAEVRLLEMFADRLQLPEAMIWETVPAEHEPLLDEFKKQVDAYNSVRSLSSESSPELSSPPSEKPVEPPIPEEPTEQTKKRSKRSTALTRKKAEALKNSDQKSQQLAASDVQVKQALHVRKGQKSGAQLATLELAAEDVTYRSIKGEALLRKVAQLSAELAAESGFDPIQILQEYGVDCNDEILTGLRQQIEPVLGKLESSTAEIVQTAWVNGIDLESEFGNLERLLNSNDC